MSFQYDLKLWYLKLDDVIVWKCPNCYPSKIQKKHTLYTEYGKREKNHLLKFKKEGSCD